MSKRETSKWIPIIEHRVLWKCALLVKEKVNWKYWLLWWWMEKWDKNEESALKRELWEEIWNDYRIKRLKELTRIETSSQIHNVFALKIKWNFHPAKNEIAWFAFYPLEDDKSWKKGKIRKAIRRNMEHYAVKAMYDFRHNHDWESYDVSDPKIEGKYFDQFHRELDALEIKVLGTKL